MSCTERFAANEAGRRSKQQHYNNDDTFLPVVVAVVVVTGLASLTVVALALCRRQPATTSKAETPGTLIGRQTLELTGLLSRSSNSESIKLSSAVPPLITPGAAAVLTDSGRQQPLRHFGVIPAWTLSSPPPPPPPSLVVEDAWSQYASTSVVSCSTDRVQHVDPTGRSIPVWSLHCDHVIDGSQHLRPAKLS